MPVRAIRYLFYLYLTLSMPGALASHVGHAQVKIDEIKIGGGLEAHPFTSVELHYVGRLEDGTVFDSSVERGEPFRFLLGSGQVIPGWDLGLRGMQAGGKRELTIPPELAYGKRGVGGIIPPDSTLVFEVEMLKVTPPPFTNIANGELEQKIADGIKLIDIRRPEEWRQTGVIEGSIMATAFDSQGRFIESFIDTLERTVQPGEEFAVICRTGNRTAVLSNWLVNKGGYKKVMNVRDGITSWIDEGRPVAKSTN